VLVRVVVREEDRELGALHIVRSDDHLDVLAPDAFNEFVAHDGRLADQAAVGRIEHLELRAHEVVEFAVKLGTLEGSRRPGSASRCRR
jgi:hypothetical protein